MSLLFGLIFGPMLTLASASMLAVAGFSRVDFVSVGWAKLVLVTLASCAFGIAAGFVVGVSIRISAAITFIAAVIGGIVGTLIPASVMVAKAAKHRLGG